MKKRKRGDSVSKNKKANEANGARLIQTRHSPEEIAWQEEIAKSIQKRPLWQCYAGWFRYCHENGMAQSPLFDPAWSQMQEFDPLMATCSLPSCSQQFRQELT